MAMGTLLLIISTLCLVTGTWKLIGILKTGKPGSKLLWGAVTGFGMLLFFLLKLSEHWFSTV